MTGQDIFIKRTFDAPRRRVWQAWTEPEQMDALVCPKRFYHTLMRMNVQVGGEFLYCMRPPDGKDVCGTGIYREVVEMEKIVMTDAFSDEKGNVVPPSYYGMGEDWTDEVLMTVTFEELEYCTTLLTLRHSGLPAGEMSEGNELGWNEAFDKLAEFWQRVEVKNEPGRNAGFRERKSLRLLSRMQKSMPVILSRRRRIWKLCHTRRLHLRST